MTISNIDKVVQFPNQPSIGALKQLYQLSSCLLNEFTFEFWWRNYPSTYPLYTHYIPSTYQLYTHYCRLNYCRLNHIKSRQKHFWLATSPMISHSIPNKPHGQKIVFGVWSTHVNVHGSHADGCMNPLKKWWKMSIPATYFWEHTAGLDHLSGHVAKNMLLERNPPGIGEIDVDWFMFQ